MIPDDVEEMKGRLRGYSAEEIKFNEPHFTLRLVLRDGDMDEVVGHILNPERLVYSYSEKDRQGDMRHTLYFEVSGSRTMVLPVVFDRGNKKGLYIITYIMRHRKWQGMLRGRR